VLSLLATSLKGSILGQALLMAFAKRHKKESEVQIFLNRLKFPLPPINEESYYDMLSLVEICKNIKGSFGSLPDFERNLSAFQPILTQLQNEQIIFLDYPMLVETILQDGDIYETIIKSKSIVLN
jgi:hypothetical protein